MQFLVQKCFTLSHHFMSDTQSELWLSGCLRMKHHCTDQRFTACITVWLATSASTLSLTLPCDAGIPLLTGGWLGKEASKKPEETQQLTFSFQAQLQDRGGIAAAQPPWQISASSVQTADEGSMLRRALLGLDKQGGLYLTPILYRPTVQVCCKLFSESVLSAMHMDTVCACALSAHHWHLTV